MANNLAKVAVTGVLALALIATALPSAVAQSGAASFGTKVTIGDSDFIPTLALPPVGAGVMVPCRINLGDTTLVTDDGYYFVNAAAGAIAALPANALRIVGVGGKAAGSLVADADTTEKGQACVAPLTGAVAVGFTAGAAPDIFFVNFDQVAGYTSGDCVYFNRDGVAGLARWDIRLSPCKIGSTTYNAGTFVELGDQDLINAAGNAAALGAGNFKHWDSQPNAILDNNDRLYVSNIALATAAQPSNNDVRLLGGVFGSKVTIGDNDFRPNLIVPAGAATPVTFCRISLGDTTIQTDDGHYAMFGVAAGVVPTNLGVNAVRLTPAAGKAAGTLVTDADTTEVGKPCVDIDAGGGLTASATTIGFAAIGAAAVNVYALNFDQIAGFTGGDCVYLDVGAPAAVTGTVSRWDIRLNDCKIGTTTYKAGTLIDLGDLDLVNAPAAIVLGAGAVWKYWDSQPNGIMDQGDLVYASSVAIGVSTRPFVNDVRVFTGTSSLMFGSMVKAGDSDFVPTLVAVPAPVTGVTCRVNLGDTSLVTDDGYYLLFGVAAAGAGTLPTNALRLNTVLGKAAGTLTTDAETTEVGKACVGGFVASGLAVAANNIWALNFDQIAGYTSGDCVYYDRDGSATLTRWDIRLTRCVFGSTTYNAGTLVELGDVDLTNAVAPVVLGAGAAFKHWDIQPNAIFDSGDRVYASTTAVAAGTNLPGVNDVRLFGDLTVAPVQPVPGDNTTACPTGQVRQGGVCVTQGNNTSPPTQPPTTTPPGQTGGEVSAQLAQLIQQNTALQGQLNSSLAQNQQLSTQVSNLSSQLSSQSQQLTSLNSQLSTLQAENQKLKTDLEAKNNANRTPGFEGILALAALGVAFLALRRKN